MFFSLYSTIGMGMKMVIRTTKALILGSVIFLTSCSKQVDVVAKQDSVFSGQTTGSTTPQLLLSASRIVLVEGNSENMAARFTWNKFACQESEVAGYALESCVAGNGFSNPVCVATQREGESIAVSVADLNEKLRQIVITETEARVEFRLKLTTKSNATLYTAPVALDVVTYQPAVNFDNSRIIRVPGNYQSWKIAQAPMLVADADPMEYEGYVNFTNAYAQFLLVKSVTTWEDGYTYTDIGAGKFGFNGRMFAVWEGAGIYKCNASANTNKWNCTRIYNFSIKGSAAGETDMEMDFDPGTLTWRITANLIKGCFIFRANHNDAIVLGHDQKAATGRLSYNAADIQVPESGKYRIVLSLMTSGNYNYGLQRIY